MFETTNENTKKLKESLVSSLSFVVVALLLLLCALVLHGCVLMKRKQKENNVWSIKANYSHQKIKGTILWLPINLTSAASSLLWLSSPSYIKWISIICLFKTWISNYCQLISRYYQIIGDFFNSLKHWMI